MKPLGQAVKVTNELLTGPSECFQAETVPEDFQSKVLDDGMTVEVRKHGPDEPKFVPKPPEDATIPRRNSFTRRGSLRRRADSGSTQHAETKTGDETGAISQPVPMVSVQDSLSAKTGDPTAKNATPISGIGSSVNQRTQSFSESSHESSRAVRCSSKSSPGDLAVSGARERTRSAEERRSSSLGAVRRLSHGTKDKFTMADKPLAGLRDCSSSGLTEDDPPRTHSDKEEIGAVLKKSSPSSHIPQPKPGDARSRKTKKPGRKR